MVRVSPGTHMRTQTFWRMVIRSASTLFLIRSAAPGALPESHTPTRVQLPHVWPTIPVPPLSSYFLSSLSFPPIINQCQAIQQQGRHSFPACLFSSSDMSLCPDPPPPPTRQPPSSFHMAAELEPKAHAANMKGCSEAVLGREKSEEEAFLSLKSFLPLATGGKRDSTVIYIIHGTNGRKQTIEWFKKKSKEFGRNSHGGSEGDVCQSLCPWTHLPWSFPFITAAHTHTVIVPCLSLTSGHHMPCFLSRHVSMGKKSFLHVLANQRKMFHSLCFLLMWTFWWTLQRQQPLTRMEARLLCRRNLSLLRRCWHWPSGLIFQTCSHDSYAFETQEISNFSICSCTVSTRYFAITHGCLFIDICGICSFFHPAFSLLTWKRIKKTPVHPITNTLCKHLTVHVYFE